MLTNAEPVQRPAGDSKHGEWMEEDLQRNADVASLPFSLAARDTVDAARAHVVSWMKVARPLGGPALIARV